MKRTMKKLALSRESLRHLAGAELEVIVGGFSRATFCATNCGPCPKPFPSEFGTCVDCTVGLGC
jgi:hypothetical protein